MLSSIRRIFSEVLLVYLLGSCRQSIFIGVQGQAPAACASDSSVTGFDTIKGLNEYMELVWKYIEQGIENSPKPPFYFSLCPNTNYNDEAIFPRLNDTFIICGNRGAVDGACTLNGAGNHILISHVVYETEPKTPPMQQVTFAGITMTSSSESSVKAFGTSDMTATFYNCYWHSNTGETAVYIAKTLSSEVNAMSVQLYQCTFASSAFSLATILNNGGSLLALNSYFANLGNAYGVITSFNGIATTIGFTTFVSTTNYATLPVYGGKMALKEVTFTGNTNAHSTIYVSTGGKLQVSNCTFNGNENGVSGAILDDLSTLTLNELNTGTGNTGVTGCNGFVSVAQGAFCSKESLCPGDCCAFDDPTCDLTDPTSPTTSPTTSSPTTAPITCPILDPDVSYWCPVARYCPWDVYTKEEKIFLSGDLGYTRRKWNYVTEFSVEKVKFSELNSTVQNGYVSLGFNAAKHDCCNGHFAGYSWSDLAGGGYDEILAALTIIGHTEDSWTNNLGTSNDGVAWVDLPDSVRDAATSKLCYNEQLWNKNTLPWPAGTVLPNGSDLATPNPTSLTNDPTKSPVTPSPSKSSPPSVKASSLPTPNPTVSSPPTFVGCRPRYDDTMYWCPFERYCEWDYYPLSVKTNYRLSVGYGRDDWNFVAESPVEAMSFSTLTDEQQAGLSDIGFNEDKHDCCLNHYNDYDWSDFDPEYGFQTVLDALETLGYNEVMWQNSIAAAYERFGWDDLPEQVQNAAYEMCWSKETWNQEDLADWPFDAELPGSDYLITSIVPTFSPPPTPVGGKKENDYDDYDDDTEDSGKKGGKGRDSSSSSNLYFALKRSIYLSVVCFIFALPL